MIVPPAQQSAITPPPRPSLVRNWPIVFDAIPSPVFLLDGCGRIIRSNRAATDLLELTPSSGGDRHSVDQLFGEWAVHGAGPRTTETTFAGQYFRATLEPLPNDPNSDDADKVDLPASICLLTDITEQRQAEDALRESEERNRLVSENIDVVFFVFSPHGDRVLFVSPAYERIWGRTCRSLYEQPQSWLAAVHPLDLPSVLAFHRPAVHPSKPDSNPGIPLPRAARGPARIEYRVQRPDGSIRWVWASSFPLCDNEGRTDRVAVLVHDITDHKQLETQLLRSQRLESIGTLAGGIAHDLNNVLTPIGLGVDLLQEVGGDETRGLLNTLRTSVERGGALIKQILAFARGRESDRGQVQLRQLVQETAQILKHTLPKSIAIEAEVPPGLWEVVGDRTQLNQVLLNLCVNARDAMPRGGKLSLQAANLTLNDEAARQHLNARPGRFVLVTVTDTGTGVAPEIRDKIFDPFFTTKAVGQGTGLGLSTVLGIVQHHGGFIDVDSKVGRGTQFRVYLPAAEGSGTASETNAPAPLPSGHGELILVVDDDVPIREMAAATLTAFGYRVLGAADGAEAVALYARQPEQVAAVLLDMMMPVMDGPTTMVALRKINPEVRMIAASGLSDPRLDDRAGPVPPPFLAKPYTTRHLLETLRRLLRQP